MLNGIQNFLQFLNDNWTSILVIISLIIGIIQKTKKYFEKSQEEKLEIAKKQINEIALKLITDAEGDYENWNKAGSIKRSQVIQEIYKEYPILSKVANQEDVIEWIDDAIDNALDSLREILSQNESKATE